MYPITAAGERYRMVPININLPSDNETFDTTLECNEQNSEKLLPPNSTQEKSHSNNQSKDNNPSTRNDFRQAEETTSNSGNGTYPPVTTFRDDSESTEKNNETIADNKVNPSKHQTNLSKPPGPVVPVSEVENSPITRHQYFDVENLRNPRRHDSHNAQCNQGRNMIACSHSGTYHMLNPSTENRNIFQTSVHKFQGSLISKVPRNITEKVKQLAKSIVGKKGTQNMEQVTDKTYNLLPCPFSPEAQKKVNYSTKVSNPRMSSFQRPGGISSGATVNRNDSFAVGSRCSQLKTVLPTKQQAINNQLSLNAFQPSHLCKPSAVNERNIDRFNNQHGISSTYFRNCEPSLHFDTTKSQTMEDASLHQIEERSDIQAISRCVNPLRPFSDGLIENSMSNEISNGQSERSLQSNSNSNESCEFEMSENTKAFEETSEDSPLRDHSLMDNIPSTEKRITNSDPFQIYNLMPEQETPFLHGERGSKFIGNSRMIFFGADAVLPSVNPGFAEQDMAFYNSLTEEQIRERLAKVQRVVNDRTMHRRVSRRKHRSLEELETESRNAALMLQEMTNIMELFTTSEKFKDKLGAEQKNMCDLKKAMKELVEKVKDSEFC